MPARLGPRDHRIAGLRALQTRKGRDEAGRYVVEGSTLMADAAAAGIVFEAIFCTAEAYERYPAARDCERGGTAVFLVDGRTFERLSDLESPTGMLAVAPLERRTPAALFGASGLYAVLADINDPGNAGTLVRSAAAFRASGVLFGDRGADPYASKTVRSSGGAAFAVPVATGGPEALAQAKTRHGYRVLGLDSQGRPLEDVTTADGTVVVVGHERHGLGRWATCCDALAAIPMAPNVESLNAGVAGSIALYELSRRSAPQA